MLVQPEEQPVPRLVLAGLGQLGGQPATIPVARAVSPLTGGNWEGTGVEPDVPVPAADAPRTAYRLARDAVLAAGTADGDVLAEVRAAGDDPFASA